MERIRAAIQKARETRDVDGTAPAGATAAAAPAPHLPGSVAANWDALEVFRPQLHLMAKNRIVTFDQKDKAHVPFDMMRTQVLSACRKNGWKTVGITSPTPACGKTVTAINLAFSFARQKDTRTVLMDVDMRKPMVAEDLGITGTHSMGKFLTGTSGVQENFLSYSETLAIGTNNRRSLHSAEILQDSKAAEAMALLHKSLDPGIVLVDMPPMLATDDVLAFLPNVDAMLLIAAAGASTVREIDECERELSERTNVMGVILNKCKYIPESYGYGY